MGTRPAFLYFSFLFLPVCVSHCWNSVMTVSKNHTRQAGKRAIVVGCAFFCVGRTGPTPSWLPTHPLPFSTCAECQTRSVEGVGRTESTPLMSSSPPGPHTGSYSLLQRSGPASSKRSDRQSKAGPALGQSWHLVIQSPEVSQQCLVPRVLQRSALLCCLWVSLSVCLCTGMCTGRSWSENSACLVYRLQLV